MNVVGRAITINEGGLSLSSQINGINIILYYYKIKYKKTV